MFGKYDIAVGASNIQHAPYAEIWYTVSQRHALSSGDSTENWPLIMIGVQTFTRKLASF